MNDPLRDEDVLLSLREVAEAMAPGLVVVVGAAALAHHRPRHARVTQDIDLAVALDPCAGRMPDGWTRENPPRQRWRDPQGRPIDIVPATPEFLARGSLDWPDGTRMSLVGFELVMRDSEQLSEHGPSNLRVADLRALTVCKVVAWTDRPGDRSKDLGDLATIFETYVESDQDRFHDEPDPALEFEARAPFLLGTDLALRGFPEHVSAMRGFLSRAAHPDGRFAHLFLREARARGDWDERLLTLRFDALRRGLDR